MTTQELIEQFKLDAKITSDFMCSPNSKQLISLILKRFDELEDRLIESTKEKKQFTSLIEEIIHGNIHLCDICENGCDLIKDVVIFQCKQFRWRGLVKDGEENETINN